MIAEDYLLLALADGSGRPASWTDYGLAGAVLADLARMGHVRAEGKKAIASAVGPDDPDLARVWATLYRHARPRQFGTWVMKVGNRHLRKAWSERLAAQGRLIRDPKKILGLFPVVRYPSLDRAAEARTRQQVRRAVLHNDTSDDRTVALAALAEATELRNRIFPKGERRQARKTIRKWLKHEPAARGVQEVIVAVYAAIAASVAASVAASSSG